MSKPHEFRWTPRQRKFASPKPRQTQPVSAMAVVLTLMFVIVGSMMIYAYEHDQTVPTDAHVIHMQPGIDGFSAPLGKDRINLRFLDAAGGRLVRVELTDASGNRRELRKGTMVFFEANIGAGPRQRIVLRHEGAWLVSTSPLWRHFERATLVVDEGSYRHVFALEGHAKGVAGPPSPVSSPST